MESAPRPADEYADYRVFRFLALWSARIVIVCLFLVVWNLMFFRNELTLLFLGNTGAIALGVSLVAAMVSYTLFKRRGGKVEKTPRPACR